MKLVFTGILFLNLAAFSQHRIDFTRISDSVSLVSANFINTPGNERDFALSPDGQELLYTVQTQGGVFQTIFYSKKLSNGSWSDPVIAPFAGQYSDLEPAFSCDGKRIYFSSNRPLSGTTIKDFDIWVVEKTKQGWGRARNLGPEINTSHDEFYPSITKEGHVYFTAAYEKGIGKEDIYVSRWENGKYQAPIPLDTAINSKFYEFNAFVSPEEDYIIFTSYGRKDDMGGGDLYISRKDPQGKWLPARHLAFLNSKKIDYCPFVSFDQKTLFFTSERNQLQSSYMKGPIKTQDFRRLLSSTLNGGGNIYWVRFEAVLKAIE